MIKVNDARFIFYDEDWNDYHSDVMRVLRKHRELVFCRDRFNFWNKYSKINWIDEKDRIYSSTECNWSFEEMVLMRLDSLFKKYDRLNILWSGGLDSTAIVSALFYRMDLKDRVSIYCTKNSVLSFEEVYNELIKHFDVHLCDESKVMEMAVKSCGLNDTVIDGECGTTFFERATLDDPFYKTNYKDVMKQMFVDGKLKSDINFIEKMEEYVSLFDVKVETFTDLKCLVNFGIKHNCYALRGSMDAVCVDSSFNRYEPFFFGDKIIDMWFYKNFEKNISMHLTKENKNRKKFSRDFIYKTFGFERVYDMKKDKLNSFIFDRMCPKMLTAVPIKTDNGFIVFEKPNDFVQTSKDGRDIVYNIEFSNLIRDKFLLKENYK